MRKILIAFGLIWIFVWCGVGIYMGLQHESYIHEMEASAQGGNLVKS